jgi:hypothetical protein
MSMIRLIAVPFASQAKQKNTPFSVFTEQLGLDSPCAGHSTSSLYDRPLMSTP